MPGFKFIGSGSSSSVAPIAVGQRNLNADSITATTGTFSNLNVSDTNINDFLEGYDVNVTAMSHIKVSSYSLTTRSTGPYFHNVLPSQATKTGPFIVNPQVLVNNGFIRCLSTNRRDLNGSLGTGAMQTFYIGFDSDKYQFAASGITGYFSRAYVDDFLQPIRKTYGFQTIPINYSVSAEIELSYNAHLVQLKNTSYSGPSSVRTTVYNLNNSYNNPIVEVEDITTFPAFTINYYKPHNNIAMNSSFAIYYSQEEDDFFKANYPEEYYMRWTDIP